MATEVRIFCFFLVYTSVCPPESLKQGRNRLGHLCDPIHEDIREKMKERHWG